MESIEKLFGVTLKRKLIINVPNMIFYRKGKNIKINNAECSRNDRTLIKDW